MTSDELKGLRLRRNVLIAELTRIEELLITEGAFEGKTYKNIQPLNQRKLSTREQFYRDAENDFRNAGSNGNYNG